MVPELIVDDLAASIALYRLLGFRVVYERPAERFAYLTLGSGADLMLEQPLDQERLYPRAELAHPYGRGMNLSIDVEDVTAVHGAVVDAGHTPYLALEERWYGRSDDGVGVRQFAVTDPDGYLLRPTQNLGARPSPSARSF